MHAMISRLKQCMGMGSSSVVSSCGYSSVALSLYDKKQADLMRSELVIIVDSADKVCGNRSKLEAHLKRNSQLIHRAFSVFHFAVNPNHNLHHDGAYHGINNPTLTKTDSSKLLLQRRSAKKITFPWLWSNTACGHPPWETKWDAETYSNPSFQETVLDCKRAAVRKTDHETGLKLDVNELNCVGRIYYYADSDDVWCEHEIDYLLVSCRDAASSKECIPNVDEVSELRWVSKEELLHNLSHEPQSFTPWFRAICNRFLFHWWENLSNLQSISDPQTIHKLVIT